MSAGGEAAGLLAGCVGEVVGVCMYADSTPFLASQKAGTPQLSIAISMLFSLARAGFQPVSVMSSGFSTIGLSSSSISSICPFASSSSFRPFSLGSPARLFVSRDVIAYSHILVAVSQSSTVPSFDMGL